MARTDRAFLFAGSAMFAGFMGITFGMRGAVAAAGTSSVYVPLAGFILGMGACTLGMWHYEREAAAERHAERVANGFYGSRNGGR